MPSVMGLLEERETVARARVEELRAALRDAEVVLERRVVAVAELAEALGGPADGGAAAEGEAAPEAVKVPVPGSVVPHWRAGLPTDVLPPDYRRIVGLVEEAGPAGARVRGLTCGLGWEPVPAKLEGARSKAKRLVARGWLAERAPGVFTPPVREAPAPVPRRPGGGPGAGS